MRNDNLKAEGLNKTNMSIFFGENNKFHKDQAEQEWWKRFSDIKQNPENIKQLMLIKLKTTHKFVESQAAKAVVGQTIY